MDGRRASRTFFLEGGLRQSVKKEEPPQISKKAEATHRYDEKGTSTEGWEKDRDAASSSENDA